MNREWPFDRTTNAQENPPEMASLKPFPILPAILMAFSILTAAPAQAAEKIAAVVNDEVISYFDLDMRISLVLAGTNVPDTPDTRRRLAPQILRRLIDESLQVQEAKRLKLPIEDADLARAFAHIERQNNVPPGQIDAFLKEKGVDKLALISQLEAEIAWAKLVGRRLRPQIQVTKEDVDDAIARIEASAGKPEHLLAEIYLPIDSPEREGEVRQLALRIMEQLKQGARFSALAQNFSRSASAASGGDLGWVREGELGSEIAQALAKMTPGQVAGPVRTIGGFHILLLREKRTSKGLGMSDVSVNLQQLFFPLPDNAGQADIQAVEEKARAASAKAVNCASMETLAAEMGTPLSGSLGTVKLSSLPASLRSAVETLDIDKPSAPVRTANGIVVLMVCERKGEDDSQAKAREQVERMIFNQRLDVAAQRYMRDLRRGAFIDVRL